MPPKRQKRHLKRLSAEKKKDTPLKENENENISSNVKRPIGRPTIPLSEQKDTHKVRLKAWNSILALVNQDIKEAELLVLEILRVYLPDLYEKIISFDSLASNLSDAFSLFHDHIRGTSFGVGLAAAVTQNFSKKTASLLTGFSQSHLFLGDKQVQEKKVPTCLNQDPLVTEIPLPHDPENRQGNLIPFHFLFPNPTSKALPPLKVDKICPPIQSLVKEKKKKEKKNKQVWLSTISGLKYIKRCGNVSDAEWDWFIGWLWAVAPKGDSKDPQRRLSWITWRETHQAYSREAREKRFKPKSINTMKEWIKAQKVKKGKFDRYKKKKKKTYADRYRCSICCAGLQALARQVRKCASEGDLEVIENYRAHVRLYRNQFRLYSSQIEQLPIGKIFLVFDYSTIHETATFKLKDLNFAAYWRDENRDLCHTFFDFWSTSSKDYNFTVKAFFTLLEQAFFRQFNECIIWGDGGLKTKEILFWFSKCADSFNLPIQMNYFAPHHGHSVCDGHFGVGKKILRIKVGVGVVESQEQVRESFDSIKNTAKGFDLGIIEDKLDHCQQFPDQIRKWFQFYFNETGEIYCREDWESEWHLQSVGTIDESEAERKKTENEEKKKDPVWRMKVPELRDALIAEGIQVKGILKPGLVDLYKKHILKDLK